MESTGALPGVAVAQAWCRLLASIVNALIHSNGIWIRTAILCVYCQQIMVGLNLLLLLLLLRYTCLCVCRALSVLAAPSMSAAAASSEAFPSEMFAFALADGRSGVLSVR
jgi:hypothetical protein